MSSDLDSSLETLGKLFFFRKNEESKGTEYPLFAGETTIGGSVDADVRLKLADERLDQIHCIIEVNENGKAVVINKSQLAPVTVNNIPVKKNKILVNQDMLDVLGKKFQYFREQKVEENPPKRPKLSKIPTVKKNRYSVSQVVYTKSPKVKTKTSVMVQKKPLRRKSTESSGAEFMDKKTPKRQPIMKAATTEKSKTTSKLFGSKSLGANIKSQVRRLSLGNLPSKSQSPKVSSRNILLKTSLISSVIKEEPTNTKNKPPLSGKKNNNVSIKLDKSPKILQKTKHVSPKKKDSLIKSVFFKHTARKSLKLEPKAVTEIKRQSSLHLIQFSPPRKSIMKTSFRKSSAKLSSEEASKMVTFISTNENEKVPNKRASLLAEKRSTVSSDESVRLILPSTDTSMSPLESSCDSDNLFGVEPLEASLDNSNESNSRMSMNRSRLSLANRRSFQKDVSSSSPNKDSRSSRRLSKDNPKYYSENLITTPRCSVGSDTNKVRQVVTPKEKSRLSLTTSTPMVKCRPSEEKSSGRSSVRQSLKLSDSVYGKSSDKVPDAFGIVDENDLTPQEQKSQFLFDDVQSQDLLARLSPIKSPVRKSLGKNMSKSNLEKSFSELSDDDDHPQKMKRKNQCDVNESQIKNVSRRRSNAADVRRSHLSKSQNKSTTKSSQEEYPTEEKSLLKSRISRRNSKNASVNLDKPDNFDQTTGRGTAKSPRIENNPTENPNTSGKFSQRKSLSFVASLQSKKIDDGDTETSFTSEDNLNISKSKATRSSTVNESKSAFKNSLQLDSSPTHSLNISKSRHSTRLSQVTNEETEAAADDLEEVQDKSARNSEFNRSKSQRQSTLNNSLQLDKSAKYSLNVSKSRQSTRLTNEEKEEAPVTQTKSTRNSEVNRSRSARLSTSNNSLQLDSSLKHNLNVSKSRQSTRLSQITSEKTEEAADNLEEVRDKSARNSEFDRSKSQRQSTLNNSLQLDNSPKHSLNVSKSRQSTRSIKEETEESAVTQSKSPRNSEVNKSRSARLSTFNNSLQLDSSLTHNLNISKSRQSTKLSQITSEETEEAADNLEVQDKSARNSEFNRSKSQSQSTLNNSLQLDNSPKHSLNVSKSRQSTKMAKETNEETEEALVAQTKSARNSEVNKSKSKVLSIELDEVSEVLKNRSVRDSDVNKSQNDSLLLDNSTTNLNQSKRPTLSRRSRGSIKEGNIGPDQDARSNTSYRLDSSLPHNLNVSKSRRSVRPENVANIESEEFADVTEEVRTNTTSNSALLPNKSIRLSTSYQLDSSPRHSTSLSRQSTRSSKGMSIQAEEIVVLDEIPPNSAFDETIDELLEQTLPEDKAVIDQSRSQSRKSIQKGRLSENTRVSASLDTVRALPEKRENALKKLSRAKSLDKGMSEILSPIPKTVRTRGARSLAPNVLRNLPNSDSSTMDSDETVPIGKNKLSVAGHLESIQNSSYKESFGDSFISSKTSTPRKSNRRGTKSNVAELSIKVDRDAMRVSTIYVNDTEDDVVTLSSTTDDDSSKENNRASLSTPTPSPKGSSRRNKSKMNESSISKLSRNESNLHNSDDYISLSYNIDEKSLSKESILLSTKTPTPEVSRRSKSSISKNTSVDLKTPRKSTRIQRSSVYVKDSDSPYTPTCTPKNNISVVIIDTPLEKVARSPKLSKTFNSTIEDDEELTTPKTALKGTRGKSLPYRPITEDISPASPVKTGKDESGFKTPFNTPGLFENIRDSVLKSRSRLLKTTSTFSADLSEELANKKTTKRPRESTGETSRLNKRRKIGVNREESDVSGGLSFTSFYSEDVIPELSKLDATATPPPHFENLTDKPVIVEPETRKHKRSQKKRGQKSPRNDLSDVAGLKRLFRTPKEQKEPKNDLTNVAGVKKLMTTPKAVKSPKNDLTNVAGVKKLFADPVQMKSPKNDLTNVAGVKKLMTTPKPVKSPKNDLTNVAGVKKLMATPKEITSPKNDLSQVAGVKKLFAVLVQRKSPKNDLRNVPSLKRLMRTPRNAKSPKNDLTDVRGVKKLMSMPKQHKSPKNDLTTIVSLRKLMSSPKTMKSPTNDLSDVEGLASLFAIHRNSNVSDQENNEDLFAKVFDKKPLKTYRAKSLSPYKPSVQDTRKTLGDVPITSPRVEKWVKEQAKLRQEQLEIGSGSGRKSSKGKQRQGMNESTEFIPEVLINIEKPVLIESQHTVNSADISFSTKPKRGKKVAKELSTSEVSRSRRKMPTDINNDIKVNIDSVGEAHVLSLGLEDKDKNRKRNDDESPVLKEPDSTSVIPLLSPIKNTKRLRGKVIENKDKNEEQTHVEEIKSRQRRGRRIIEEDDNKADEKEQEIESKQPSRQTTRRGNRQKQNLEHENKEEEAIELKETVVETKKNTEEMVEQEPKSSRQRRGKKEIVEGTKAETKVTKRGNRQRENVELENPKEDLQEEKGGSAKNKKNSEQKTQTESKSTRRRGKKEEITKEEDLEEKETEIKEPSRHMTRRGNRQKEIVEHVNEKEETKSRPRRRKALEEDESIEKHEAKEQEAVAKEKQQEVKEKTIRGKTEETETKKETKTSQRRGRKVHDDDDTTEKPNFKEQETIVKTDPHEKRGKAAKGKEKAEQSQTEKEIKTRPRRGRKVVEEDDITETTEVKNHEAETKGDKDKEKEADDEAKTTRRARSRKEVVEEPTKNAKNSRLRSVAEPEERPESPTVTLQKTRGRRKANVPVEEEEGSATDEKEKTVAKKGKKHEVTMEEVPIKRGKKVRAEEKTTEADETETDVTSVPKRTRGKRNDKVEEATMEDNSKKDVKSLKKTVGFTESLVETPSRGRRRNVQAADHDTKVDIEEIAAKKARKGKNQSEVDASKGNATVEAPPPKRSRRGVTKEDAETKASTKTETNEKRTRRK